MPDQEVLTYLDARSLPASVAPDWDISWQTGAHIHAELTDRITFPVWGHVRSRDPLMVVGRAVDDDRKPKYWNTHGSRKSQFLYGLWKRREGAIPIIVEGYTDCWALSLLGFFPLAIMGSTMSMWQAAHVASLSKLAILLPDSDARSDGWESMLNKFGVRSATPTGLYPIDAPPKIDPCWMYVEARERLERVIKETESWLKPG